MADSQKRIVERVEKLDAAVRGRARFFDEEGMPGQAYAQLRRQIDTGLIQGEAADAAIAALLNGQDGVSA